MCGPCLVPPAFASAGDRTGCSPTASTDVTDLAVPAGLPKTEAAVLSGVGFEPRGVDAVARRSGVEMPGVLPALALLELKGFVSRDSVGAYVRRAAP